MGERGDFGAHVVGTYYTYRIICVVKKHACDEHELVIISSRARRRGLCCRSNRFPPRGLWRCGILLLRLLSHCIYIRLPILMYSLSYYLLCPCTVHHHQCRSTGSIYINTTTILYIPIIGAWRRHANRLRARAPSKKAWPESYRRRAPRRYGAPVKRDDVLGVSPGRLKKCKKRHTRARCVCVCMT